MRIVLHGLRARSARRGDRAGEGLGAQISRGLHPRLEAGTQLENFRISAMGGTNSRLIPGSTSRPARPFPAWPEAKAAGLRRTARATRQRLAGNARPRGSRPCAAPGRCAGRHLARGLGRGRCGRDRARRACRTVRRSIFIGCEGESERGYVAFLGRLAEQVGLAVHLDPVVLQPGGGDPLAIVELAVKR